MIWNVTRDYTIIDDVRPNKQLVVEASNPGLNTYYFLWQFFSVEKKMGWALL